MMKHLILKIALGTVLVLAGSCSSSKTETFSATAELDRAIPILQNALHMLNDTSLNPRNREEDGLRLVQSGDWTSGFFPGMLWIMFEHTGDPFWQEAAHHYTMNVEDQQYNGGTHDMGFKLYCSFGNGYRLTGDPHYRDVLVQGATTLITRFNPTVGAIRSWDHNSDKWDYPVIIDNMMNLELLFWATRETGDSSYYHIAVQHAETTMKNHFREDHSSYHVISYDTLSGEVVKRNTHQGHSHESAWARGQAWGLYGYTMTYRETGDARFLDQANAIAGFILSHPRLPDDGVPYWDYDAPDIPNTYRDVSAGAIAASALLELAGYVPEKQEAYDAAADQMLQSLATSYTFETDEALPFLLDHSVGHLPHDSEIDVPIIYADYYYLEALLRTRQK